MTRSKVCLLASGIVLISLINSCTNAYSRLNTTAKTHYNKISEILEQGKWRFEEEDCSQSFLSLTFDKLMMRVLADSKLSDSNKVNHYIYDIHSVSENSLFMSIRGEKRLDDHGNPVKWHLILVDSNTFYWRRDDWDINGGTKNMVLCR